MAGNGPADDYMDTGHPVTLLVTSVTDDSWHLVLLPQGAGEFGEFGALGKARPCRTGADCHSDTHDSVPIPAAGAEGTQATGTTGASSRPAMLNVFSSKAPFRAIT